MILQMKNYEILIIMFVYHRFMRKQHVYRVNKKPGMALYIFLMVWDFNFKISIKLKIAFAIGTVYLPEIKSHLLPFLTGLTHTTVNFTICFLAHLRITTLRTHLRDRHSQNIYLFISLYCSYTVVHGRELHNR